MNRSQSSPEKWSLRSPVVLGFALLGFTLAAARAEAVLTPEQQEKIEKDLVAARNRQASGVQKASQGQN